MTDEQSEKFLEEYHRRTDKIEEFREQDDLTLADKARRNAVMTSREAMIAYDASRPDDEQVLTHDADQNPIWWFGHVLDGQSDILIMLAFILEEKEEEENEDGARTK